MKAGGMSEKPSSDSLAEDTAAAPEMDEDDTADTEPREEAEGEVRHNEESSMCDGEEVEEEEDVEVRFRDSFNP